ncbi:hypothetical protein BFN67_21185 [Pseudaminobacter manganicus]|uniref:DUF4432 domain-containing protein n=1 Tax=Manganibacter manganicus TaxID=1873176 RepID=A0A1V8RN12_9HYPH|nr:hypothetical protein BFN67_21185 [Pseudaminobacter manganicus]
MTAKRTAPTAKALRALVGDLRQIASVKRFVLSDGPEAGIETLAFSTGGGLDFWVTAGRGMDIATLSWRGIQLAWQSPAGFRIPSAGAGAGDKAFNRAFGGFLNTCGFEHIRQPADGHPLHGSAPFTPARLNGYGEDWNTAEPLLYCEGEFVVWTLGGGGHRLHRRIETPIGGSTLRIVDTVEVIGPDPAPIMALYHFNLGYPLHREGTEISLDGVVLTGPLPRHEPAPAQSTLHVAPPGRVVCRVDGGGATVAFRWSTDTLPWLQLWRDLRPRCGVLSIEPCSIARSEDGRNEPVSFTEPGQSLRFEIEVILADVA